MSKFDPMSLDFASFEMNLFDDVCSALPPNLVVHFRPKPVFLKWLGNYIGERFTVECGAGQCKFTEAMHGVGIKALAIEPRPAPGVAARCHNFLFPMTVQRSASFIKDAEVVIVARPDHSGWFADLCNLVPDRAELIYIGLEKNLDIDIPDDCGLELLYQGAGEDDENVWRVVL